MDGPDERELDVRAARAAVAARPGRRAAAIAALAMVPLLALLVLFVVLRHLGLILVLVAAFALFFAGSWTALSRRGWWRAAGVAAGGLGAVAALAAVVGIGWVSTGAVVAIFVVSGLFVELTRYALGDRLEDE